MKLHLSSSPFTERRSRRGFLEVDLLVGLAILSIAIMPLGLAFVRERQVLRQEYFHNVANEVVDGEMEILMAGGWKNIPEGSQVYPVQSQAMAVLPAGHFQLTKTGKHLRLEWEVAPGNRHSNGIGTVVREVDVK